MEKYLKIEQISNYLEEKKNDLITRAEKVLNQAKAEQRELTDDEAQELAEIRDDVKKIKDIDKAFAAGASGFPVKRRSPAMAKRTSPPIPGTPRAASVGRFPDANDRICTESQRAAPSGT